MTLADMRPGRLCRVTAVEGPEGVRLRLLDMGLAPGSLLSVEGRAPLGDPLVLSLRGGRLCLRLQDARLVEVSSP